MDTMLTHHTDTSIGAGTMMDFEFVDELPGRALTEDRKQAAEDLLMKLRLAPDRWAIVARNASSSDRTSWADRYTGSWGRHFPKAIQIASRTDAAGVVNVYARYRTGVER